MAGERKKLGNREWRKLSRTAQRVANNLGIIYGSEVKGEVPKVRSSKLDWLDAYYDRKQYDHLAPWDTNDCSGTEDNYVPVSARKPKINFPFAKILCQRVTGKLLGNDTFPNLNIEDDPETVMFLKAVMKLSNFQSRILEPVRRTLNSGSTLVRFYVVDGAVKIEHYLGKYCYPEFNTVGELDSVRIQYVYDDPKERDPNGKPIQKWYRLDLGSFVDVSYDNPVYHPHAQPEFVPVEEVHHDLGYVQGTWFRTGEDKHSPDGPSIIEDITDFIDEINYSLSQSSTAVKYNQDPQLAINGLDADGVENLIKSSAKAWNLGRDGKGQFIESSMKGVETAEKLREKMFLHATDAARIVFLDPEKFASNAQSGKAMETLHGPFVELINELRLVFGPLIVSLLLKIAITLLVLAEDSEIGIDMPKDWSPKSMDVVLDWPPIFPMTVEDLQKKVAVAVSASSANLLSRETMTRWLAKDFGVEDVEAEVSKVNAQPVLNPFGAF